MDSAGAWLSLHLKVYFTFVYRSLPLEAMVLVFCPAEYQIPGLQSRRCHFLVLALACTCDKHEEHVALQL